MTTISIAGNVNGDVADTIYKNGATPQAAPIEFEDALKALGKEQAERAMQMYASTNTAVVTAAKVPVNEQPDKDLVRSMISGFVRYFPTVGKIALTLWAPHLAALGIPLEKFFLLIQHTLEGEKRG